MLSINSLHFLFVVCFAQFAPYYCAATSMSLAQSSRLSCSVAFVKQADLLGGMLRPEAIFASTCIAPNDRAGPVCPDDLGHIDDLFGQGSKFSEVFSEILN